MDGFEIVMKHDAETRMSTSEDEEEHGDEEVASHYIADSQTMRRFMYKLFRIESCV